MFADPFYGLFIACVWLAWWIYWWFPAARTKRTRRAESWASRLSHIVPLLIGAALIAIPIALPWPWLAIPLLPPGPTTYGTGVMLLLFGLAFSVWARIHLAGNWSGTVTLKEDHELIRTGPYRWVRHPIYTGLLLAFFGSALARGESGGFIGVALIAAAFVRKLRIEERWMREVFASEYERYSARVPALFPLVY